MLESIHSARVIGVVESLRMTPFCFNSAFVLTGPNIEDVITDIAMIPGTKKSMNVYFVVYTDWPDVRITGELPDSPWFMPPTKGRLVTGQNPKMDAMLNSLQITGTGKTVGLTFTVPAELLDMLNGAAAARQLGTGTAIRK